MANIRIIEDQILSEAYYTKMEKFVDKSANPLTQPQSLMEDISQTKKRTILNKLQLGNFIPKLTKTSDFVDLSIDFTEIPKRKNRFIDIINKKEADELNDEDEIKTDETPGEKLLNFNNKLKMELAEERLKQWTQRLNDAKKLKTEEEEAAEELKSVVVDEQDAILDDDQEMSDNDTESLTSDTDENDILDENYGLDEKPVEKSDFVEDEAEESEIDEILTEDEEDAVLGNDDFNNVEKELVDCDADDESVEKDDLDSKKSKIAHNSKRKNFKRIKVNYLNDSDSEDEAMVAEKMENVRKTVQKTRKVISRNASFDLSVISPVSNLSILQDQSEAMDSSEDQCNDDVDDDDDEGKSKFEMPSLGKDVTVQEKMQWMWQQQEHDDVFGKLLSEIKDNTIKINEMKSLLKYDLTHMTELIYLKNRNVEILLELFEYRDHKIDLYKHDRNLKSIRSKFLENEKHIDAISKQFQFQAQQSEVPLSSHSVNTKIINESINGEISNFHECLNKFCCEMNENVESIVQKCVGNKVAEFSVCDDVSNEISENKKVLMKLNRLRRFLRKLRKRQEIRQHYRNMYLRKIKKRDLSSNSILSKIKQFNEQTSVIKSVNLDYVDEDALIISGFFDEINTSHNKKYPELTTQENELLDVCSEPFFHLNGNESNADPADKNSDKDSQQFEVDRKASNLRIESSDEDENNSILEMDLDGDQSRFSENEAKVVDYDSEENEVIVNKQEQNDFFEKEAELSGSDWGSADEDEKNLDEMEPELGDQDVFNEKKLHRELERIHMRQVLDTDKKEVRLIQELVFEDGDLFSENGGRQRQYRWKNIDLSAFGNDNDKENDADADELIDDDEDTEEHWRKFRHEKALFLEKYKNNINVEESNTFDATEIFNYDSREKLVIEKHSRDTEVFIKPTVEDKFEPFTEKSNKRGSFLSRNDKVLEKLAVISRSVCASSVRQRKRVLFVSCDSNSSSRSSSMYPNSNKVKKLKLDSINNNDSSESLKI